MTGIRFWVHRETITMPQPHKGPRRQVKLARIPEYVATRVDEYAAERNMALSEAVADLVAIALDLPLPSVTLPRPRHSRVNTAQEVLPLDRAS
jgi:hypothetical protein